MKNWMRIFLLCFVLIGSTVFFAHRSLNQFNNALDNLSASYTAVIIPAHSSSNVSKTSLPASSTPIVVEDTVVQDENTDPNFQLTFSPKKDGVYIGCIYQISWLASTTIKSLETTLVDAGTRKPTGPIASGLAKENNIETDSQNLKWKVGIVWPGKYFIEISSVNGIATDEISQRFIINEMPDGINAEDKKNLCDTTGGSL